MGKCSRKCQRESKHTHAVCSRCNAVKVLQRCEHCYRQSVARRLQMEVCCIAEPSQSVRGRTVVSCSLHILLASDAFAHSSIIIFFHHSWYFLISPRETMRSPRKFSFT